MSGEPAGRYDCEYPAPSAAEGCDHAVVEAILHRGARCHKCGRYATFDAPERVRSEVLDAVALAAQKYGVKAEVWRYIKEDAVRRLSRGGAK